MTIGAPTADFASLINARNIALPFPKKLAVSIKEQEAEVAEKKAEVADTAEIVTARPAARAAAQIPVPFLLALGFATATITLTLIERFGTIPASWTVAGGFTPIGLGATRARTPECL